MKAVKVTPNLLVARVEVAKVAQLIELSWKCGTHCKLCCGLARVRVESDKIVLKIRLSPKFGVCAGGNSENGEGNIFPAQYKDCGLAPLSVQTLSWRTNTKLQKLWNNADSWKKTCMLYLFLPASLFFTLQHRNMMTKRPVNAQHRRQILIG